ncbi:hypothetical protein B0H14DRAFT_2250416, partial [Mycena olivaceomarginata]
MNLKRYLTSEGENRAKWCNLADNRLSKETPEGINVHKDIRDSPFKQSWKPLQRTLPRALKKMLTTARDFHLTLDALALSKEVKENLPIFFHTGIKEEVTKHNNSKCANCLRDRHKMRSAEDALKIVERNYLRHSRRKNCACNPCRADRNLGCGWPVKCQDEAIRFLDDLAEKWDPRRNVHQPNPELTEEERDSNTNALNEDKVLVFDPKIIVG